MNPFEMVIGIILIVTIGQIVKARMGVRRDWKGNEYSVRDDSAATAENFRLKEELTALRERVQVLERVVTDNESGLRLEHEIEKLRDRSKTEN